MKITADTKMGEAIHIRYSHETLLALRQMSILIKQGQQEISVQGVPYGSQALNLARSFGIELKRPDWIEKVIGLLEEIAKEEGIDVPEDPFACDG